MEKQTWIILGASSSIARSFAKYVASDGADVILAGRDLDDIERTAGDIRIRTGAKAKAIKFDASQFDTHIDFVAKCKKITEGPINLFVAFARLPENPQFNDDVEDIINVVNVNYLGAMSIISHFIPWLEAQKSGHIAVIGSVSGDRGRRRNYLYASTKAGLHVYLQGLQVRLFEKGINITIIKPGYIDTAMTYGAPGVFLPASPEKCARACFKGIKNRRSTFYYPWFWRWIMGSVKLLPSFIFKRLPI